MVATAIVADGRKSQHYRTTNPRLRRLARVEKLVNIKAAILSSAVLVATVVATTNVYAGSNPYKTPCHDDRQRLCSMASPGKAGKCLKQHKNDLSPACKAFLSNKK
jgi:hypothetical protein